MNIRDLIRSQVAAGMILLSVILFRATAVYVSRTYGRYEIRTVGGETGFCYRIDRVTGRTWFVLRPQSVQEIQFK